MYISTKIDKYLLRNSRSRKDYLERLYNKQLYKSTVNAELIKASVENNTPNIITLFFNKKLDNTSIPEKTCFKLSKGSVISVEVNDYNVILLLNCNIYNEDIVEVSYKKPSTNYLKDSTNRLEIRQFCGYILSNNIFLEPSVISAIIPEEYPDTVILTFDIPLNRSLPELSWFTITNNSISNYTLDETSTRLIFTVDTPYDGGDFSNIIYRKPSNNPLQGINDGYVKEFNIELINYMNLSILTEDTNYWIYTEDEQNFIRFELDSY